MHAASRIALTGFKTVRASSRSPLGAMAKFSDQLHFVASRPLLLARSPTEPLFKLLPQHLHLLKAPQTDVRLVKTCYSKAVARDHPDASC